MPQLSEAQMGTVEADIEALYRAGRVTFPNNATWASDRAAAMIDVLNAVNAESARLGDRGCLPDAIEICVEVHAALKRLTETFNDCAVGMVKVADDFVATEDYASEAFARVQSRLTDPSDPDYNPDLTADERADDRVVAQGPDGEQPEEAEVPGVDAPESEGGLGEDPNDRGAEGVDGPEDLPDRPEAEQDRRG